LTEKKPAVLMPETSLKPSPHLSSTTPPAAGKSSRDVEPGVAVNPKDSSSGGMGGLYFLLAVSSLMFGIWFVGPRLVEEYYYAAEIGRARAEYESAVDQLSDQPLSQVSFAYQLVAQRIRPSVVSVNAVKSSNEAHGLGSGVILSDEGYIITNAHVLEGANSFFVELYDRRQFQATLIGRDEISDLAVLKINAPKLIPATWGNSQDVDVGSIVWAIGSPYGFEQTVTSGIVSGKNREGDPTEKYNKQSLIQTDAAVNPGNSGGPLVDAQGRVIGINTSIFGKTFQGISFAVPSETAMFVSRQLIQNGRVIRGYLGVQPAEVEHRDSVDFGLPDLNGAKLVNVQPASPAAIAGMRNNDIIRSWGGVELEGYRSLYRLAEETPPQSLVDVVYLRSGEERVARVRVGQLPE
jgi:S1-C subfamily serine protease